MALEYYEKAFDNFKSLNHLAGMYLSRKEALKLCSTLKDVTKYNQYSADYSKYEY